MKRAAIILIVLGILVIGATAAVYVLRDQSNSLEPVVPAQSGNNPFNFSLPGTEVPEGKIPLALDDRSVMYVDDFTQVDQPEWAGPDSGYNVAGDGSGSFAITYYPSDQAGNPAEISVALLAEPLSGARLDAEAALKEKFGVSQAELCALNIMVFTTSDMGEEYAGYDLGVSGCPGAINLP